MIYTLHWELIDGTIEDEGFSPVSKKAESVKLAKHCAKTCSLYDVHAILVLDENGKIHHTAKTGKLMPI